MNSKIPSLKITIISFLLFFINAFLLMYFGHFLKEYSDVPKIDFQINGYTIDTVKELFSDYGKSGRNLYFWMTIIDIPFPFLVAFFGYSYFGYTWKKWNFKIVYKFIVEQTLSKFAIHNLLKITNLQSFIRTFQFTKYNKNKLRKT